MAMATMMNEDGARWTPSFRLAGALVNSHVFGRTQRGEILKPPIGGRRSFG
jgi:hypothetical protein